MADKAETERILSTVDDTTFESDDLGLIMDDVSTCAAKWETLSARLGLPGTKISAIKTESPTSTDTCWNKALLEWIGQNYNTKKYPLPSWRSLLKAIAREENALFKRLAAEHKSEGDEVVPSSKPVAAGGGASGGGNEKDKMAEKITNMRQLTMIKYTKNGEEKTINVISRAAHSWTKIADLITDDLHVVDNLRDEYRGKNEEAFKQLLKDHFIGANPIFGGYTQDWKGLVKLLNDVRLGSLASEVEEAIKSQSS